MDFTTVAIPVEVVPLEQVPLGELPEAPNYGGFSSARDVYRAEGFYVWGARKQGGKWVLIFSVGSDLVVQPLFFHQGFLDSYVLIYEGSSAESSYLLVYQGYVTAGL